MSQEYTRGEIWAYRAAMTVLWSLVGAGFLGTFALCCGAIYGFFYLLKALVL